MVFKRSKIYGCANTSAINVCVIIPTPQSFILIGIIIKALSIFRFIMTIGSCQAPLPIKRLLIDTLEEKALKADWLLNIRHISLS